MARRTPWKSMENIVSHLTICWVIPHIHPVILHLVWSMLWTTKWAINGP
jgi:hypothetical protein